MSTNTQVEDLMVQLQPKIEKVRVAFRALDNFMIKVESLLGAKDHLFLILTDIYGSYGYLQRWTNEYLSMADEITSPFYSTIESMRVSLHNDKRNFENIFIAFQGRVDKDAIMRAEAKMAVSKWQANAEKNGDGKNKKFEKTKLLASQMTAASELSRIHHEALVEDLLAFGEQCESYFTPSLSSLISFTGKFLQCKEKFARKFGALSSLLSNPYLHPIDPSNLGPRSPNPSVLPHESPLPPADESPLAKGRSNSDSSQPAPASPAKGLFKRGSGDSTPCVSPPPTPPRSPRSRTLPQQSSLGSVFSTELSPASARRITRSISSTDSSPSDSPVQTDSASSSPLQRRLSRPPSVSYPSAPTTKSTTPYSPKPPLNPSLSSPMLVNHSLKTPEIILPKDDSAVSSIPRSPLSITSSNSPTVLAEKIQQYFTPSPSTPESPTSISSSPNLPVTNPSLPILPSDSPLDSPILAVGSPLLPMSAPLLHISSPVLSSSSSATNSPRSPFPTSPSLDSFTDVTSKSMDMAMLLVELAAGEAGGGTGIGLAPGAGIGGQVEKGSIPNGSGNAAIQSVSLSAGGKGGSFGRYSAPPGAIRHGRFSVDVSRLAQLAIGGISNIANMTSSSNTANSTNNNVFIPNTMHSPTTGNGYTSGSEDGNISPHGLNSSTDSFKMPTLNYSAKTADEVIKSFDDLLANPLAVQYFHEFVKTRVCEENILFWMEVQDFKNFGFHCDRKHKSTEPANIIYATYLRQGAEKEVNIPESLRETIAERLNEPTVTMFDEAQAEVLTLMRSDLFSSFAGTEIAKRLTARLNKKDFSLFIPTYSAMGLLRKDGKDKESKVSKSSSKKPVMTNSRTN